MGGVSLPIAQKELAAAQQAYDSAEARYPDALKDRSETFSASLAADNISFVTSSPRGRMLAMDPVHPS